MTVQRAGWRRALGLGLGVALGALVVSWAPLPAPAAPAAPAQTSSCESGQDGCQCAVVDGVLVCHLVSTTPGGEAPPSSDDEPDRSGPAVAPTAVWRRYPQYSVCDPLGGNVTEPDLCTATSCTLPDGRPGFLYFENLVDVATNEVVANREYCYDPQGATAPLPVAPPTLAQVLGRTPIPEPVIGRNPSGRGLTGLASWFWVDGAPETVAVDLTLQGWKVSGSLEAGEWRWTVGDAEHTSAGPGSEAAPAVEHTFERTGTVEVAVDVAWSGSYTVSGYGTSFTVPGLATTTSSSLDYEVIEVRSVVDASEAGR